MILWKGYCHVHTDFLPEHVARARELAPGGRIVVHPECKEEVVMAADAAGSTEYICRYVEDAADGTVIYVGTEINLVERLAREYHPRKDVRPLARSMCPNMYRIDLPELLYCLDHIGEVNVVKCRRRRNQGRGAEGAGAYARGVGGAAGVMRASRQTEFAMVPPAWTALHWMALIPALLLLGCTSGDGEQRSDSDPFWWPYAATSWCNTHHDPSLSDYTDKRSGRSTRAAGRRFRGSAGGRPVHGHVLR